MNPERERRNSTLITNPSEGNSDRKSIIKSLDPGGPNPEKVSTEAEANAAIINSSFEHLKALIDHLDSVNSQIIQRHEEDFMAAYKDHMLKVQRELIAQKKKNEE